MPRWRILLAAWALAIALTFAGFTVAVHADVAGRARQRATAGRAAAASMPVVAVKGAGPEAAPWMLAGFAVGTVAAVTVVVVPVLAVVKLVLGQSPIDGPRGFEVIR